MGVNGAELNSEKVSEHRGKSSVCSRVPVPSAPQPPSWPDQHFCSTWSSLLILICSLSSTKVLRRTRNELRIRETTTVAPGAPGYWTAPVLSGICILKFNVLSRTLGYPRIKANAWILVLTTTELCVLAVLDLQKFNFDVERAKGIIHSRIINLAVLKRSWRHVDAFTLQIYRYLQALIDLASAASQFIGYCVAAYAWVSSAVYSMAEGAEMGDGRSLLTPDPYSAFTPSDRT